MCAVSKVFWVLVVTLSLVSCSVSPRRRNAKLQISFLLDFVVHFCTCSQTVFCDRQFFSVANYCTPLHRENGSFEVVCLHQQRRQNLHATHCAQGRVQSQLASASSQHGRRLHDTAPVPHGSDRRRKLGRRIWDLGRRSMHRNGSLPAPLSCARAGVRLQPAPAAAPSDKPYHPDSSRLVRRSRSGPLRAGTPSGHHDRGVGIPSVLALIGARDAGLGLRRFRGQNKCA